MSKKQEIKLSSIKVNPSNPRLIKDTRFKILCENIKKYPKFLELRPIIVESKKNPIILGGNQRYRALIHLGYKEIPESWIRYADELTPEEVKAFIILDNVEFGEHDWDMLANEWDKEELEGWGVDLPVIKESEGEPEEAEAPDETSQWFLNIRCESEAECQKMYEKFIEEGLDVKIVT